MEITQLQFLDLLLLLQLREEFANRWITVDAASHVPLHKLSSVEEYTDVFSTVTYRKNIRWQSPTVVIVECRRKHLIGVRKSAPLPTVSRMERFGATEITADDVEMSEGEIKPEDIGQD
jgi:hypothetical protein